MHSACDQAHFRAARPSLGWGCTVLIVAAVAGCRPQAPPGSATPQPSAATPKLERDHFAVALDFLKQRDEHNLDRAANETSYHLNRWIQDQTGDPRWTIDRDVLATLPDAIRRAPATKDMLSDRALTALEFHTRDVLFLEEHRWLRAIAQWAAEQPIPPDLNTWILERGLSSKTARQLAGCVALFDWTVRNLQLEEQRPYPKPTTAGPLLPTQADAATADWPPPMLGLPGPGYDKYPWHVLLYGRGDMQQRARVFLLLLRQLRITGAMLSIDQRTGRAEEWLPAALLDGQLYLFDTALGLPIPGPGGRGIATLADVVQSPQLLEELDLGDRYRYRVRPSDLDQVVALIDASPESLSQRMRLVEQQLDATDQMMLSVAAGGVKAELSTCQHLKDIRLWAVPLEAAMYRQAYDAMLAKSPEMQWQEFLEHGVFEGLSVLVRGRRQHLLGNLEKQDETPGATSYYLSARMTDAQIEIIGTNRDVQKALGLEKTLDTNERQWEQKLTQVKRLQVESKGHASYWLGLLHMERGEFDVAVNWLKVRTLEANPEGPWTHGARYNLARCYEALGRLDEARQLFLIDESPQRHGCLLRARQLEAAAAAPAAASPDESATDAAAAPAETD
ncbi:MAG: CDC27 family protein [Pirellulaceae bacterium]|nr:CDC27 family protein [Pirellulaceae bacterium]